MPTFPIISICLMQISYRFQVLFAILKGPYVTHIWPSAMLQKLINCRQFANCFDFGSFSQHKFQTGCDVCKMIGIMEAGRTFSVIYRRVFHGMGCRIDSPFGYFIFISLLHLLMVRDSVTLYTIIPFQFLHNHV